MECPQDWWSYNALDFFSWTTRNRLGLWISPKDLLFQHLDLLFAVHHLLVHSTHNHFTKVLASSVPKVLWNHPLCILSIWWRVNSIAIGSNISHMSWCVDHHLSLEYLNNIVKLFIELPWKMVVVMFFNYDIPKWCVVVSPHIVIKNFLVNTI